MAWARWVFPTPGGPRKSTSLACRIKLPVARSKISLRWIDGLKLQSKSSSVFKATEISGFGATFHLALLPDIQFVLTDQFQELRVTKPVSDRLLQPHVQGLDQAGEPELFQGAFKSAHEQF